MQENPKNYTQAATSPRLTLMMPLHTVLHSLTHNETWRAAKCTMCSSSSFGSDPNSWQTLPGCSTPPASPALFLPCAAQSSTASSACCSARGYLWWRLGVQPSGWNGSSVNLHQAGSSETVELRT